MTLFVYLGDFFWMWPWVAEISSADATGGGGPCLDVPGALTLQLSGNRFLWFPHLEAIRREAAPSGEQTAFLLLPAYVFEHCKFSCCLKWDYRWRPLTGVAWDEYSSPRLLHGTPKAENCLQNCLSKSQIKISPTVYKLAISTKKQVLSVRKLSPAHFQVELF